MTVECMFLQLADSVHPSEELDHNVKKGTHNLSECFHSLSMLC